MFIVYHSNNLDVQKDILLDRMRAEPLSDPFRPETILVQSPGMAQWLQLKIAEEQGVAANLAFPMPAGFIWRQYVDNLPDVAQQSQFGKEAMTWRLMELIKRDKFRPHLAHPALSGQQKLYQLARKIADLFDQYLVYRPDWIMAWEKGDDDYIERQIRTQQHNESLLAQIAQDIAWQGELWRALTGEIGTAGETEVHHRARLHSQYLRKLERERPQNLPPRIFIFGISSLPKVYLETFQAISRYCDVHLFFNNPSRYYWGDIVDPLYLRKLTITRRTLYGYDQTAPLFSAGQLDNLAQEKFELTAENERLQIGNPLLAAWGKQGRDFFYLLSQMDTQEIQAYVETAEDSLLAQVQNRILNLVPNGGLPLENSAETDRTLTVHSCYSAMREVEVLHDYLLRSFQQDGTLTPKDIVVMVPDIDKYAPYIRAVFRQYDDRRRIPFSIADNKLSENDVLLAAFLSLLQLKESRFGAEEILALLDIPAVRARFGIELADLAQIRHWTAEAGVRFGLAKYDDEHPNYNAWQAGLERMLLGYAMREENGIWQDSLGLDGSYGLKGRLTGALAAFIERLRRWQQVLQQEHEIVQWQQYLLVLTEDFFSADEQTADTLTYINNTVRQLTEQLQGLAFTQPLGSEVIAEVMTEKLNAGGGGMKFLVGKVSFCTLLPMRSIPFRVVCLLGMNDGDYPRRQTADSFDLMQYHRQKGDRSRRDDDRYLFLEALLAAQEALYISYVGRSLVDNSGQEPSVLVSQLLDYLADNAASPMTAEDFIQSHTMTVFSPENFGEAHRTFAREWLPLTGNRRQAVEDFIGLLPEAETEDRIELTQLIAFIKNPVRFFFEKRLGTYFREEDELIGENENFTLEGLDLYGVNNALLNFPESVQADFFARLKVKGILPRGAFGQVYEQKVRSEMTAFCEELGGYLQQTPDSETVELPVPTIWGDILLYGILNRLFGTQKRRVVWRAGKSHDGYLIENWLYYLVQCAVQDNVEPPLFYSKDGGVVRQTFKTIEKTTALSQLKIYVEAYLQGGRQIQPVPTADTAKWLKTEQPEKLKEYLDKLAYGDEYGTGDIYWRRVLNQTQRIDFTEMKEKTSAWFDLMHASLTKEK